MDQTWSKQNSLNSYRKYVLLPFSQWIYVYELMQSANYEWENLLVMMIYTKFLRKDFPIIKLFVLCFVSVLHVNARFNSPKIRQINIDEIDH